MSERSERMQHDRAIAEGHRPTGGDLTEGLRAHVNVPNTVPFTYELSGEARWEIAAIARIAGQVAEAYPELPGVVTGMGDIQDRVSRLLG